MQENESSLGVVDVEFTSEKQELVPIGQVMHEEGTNFEQDQENSQNIKSENTDTQSKVFSSSNFSNDTNEEESIKRDTSFRNYEKQEEEKYKKRKKGFIRRAMQCVTTAIGIILVIPILIGCIGILGGGVVTSLGIIGLGVVGIAFTAFIMTVQPGLIGLLGVFICLGLLSGGGLALCLTILLIRGMNYILRVIRNNRAKAREV